MVPALVAVINGSLFQHLKCTEMQKPALKVTLGVKWCSELVRHIEHSLSVSKSRKESISSNIQEYPSSLSREGVGRVKVDLRCQKADCRLLKVRLKRWKVLPNASDAALYKDASPQNLRPTSILSRLVLEQTCSAR